MAKTTDANRIEDAIDDALNVEKGKSNRDAEEEIKDRIMKMVQTSNQAYTGTDEGVLDVLNAAMAHGRGRRKRAAGGTMSTKDYTKWMIENPAETMIGDMFVREEERVRRYFSYNQLYEIVPEMADAAETMAHNIMSPDSFGRSTLDFEMSTSMSEDAKRVLRDRLDEIYEGQGIDVDAFNIILNAVVEGDTFIAVVDLDEEIDKNLGDRRSFMEEKRWKASKWDGRNEMRLEFESLLDESRREKDDLGCSGWDDFSNGVDGFVDGVFAFGHRNARFMDRVRTTRREFMQEDDGDYDERNRLSRRRDLRTPKDTSRFMLETLPSEKVVKIMAGNSVLGYYHIDFDEDMNFAGVPNYNSMRLHDQFQSFYGRNYSNTNSDYAKRKFDFFSDAVIAALSRRLNKKFVKDNPQFREIIYNILKGEKFLQNQVVISFLQPRDVVHFHPGGKVYGKSLYYKSLFMGKLYLVILVSSIMQHLVRAVEEKIFYVETGLDNDTEGAVLKFIKDIKTKNYTIDDLGDISSAIRIASAFKDLYVPVVDGERPVDVDTIAGSDVSIENEFLEYVRGSMISGTGIPEAFLGLREEVEFARTLTMQNGNFVRKVIQWQIDIATSFTELFRNVYSRIYEDEPSVNRNFKVVFTPPATLNNTNLSENFSTVQGIAENISNVIVEKADDNPETVKKVQKEVMKKYLPQIDWEGIDELYKNIKLDEKQAALDNPSAAAEDEGI